VLLLLPWSQGRGGGSDILFEQVHSNFNFPSKFVIVLLCRLLVDSNTFLKMCIFKMSF